MAQTPEIFVFASGTEERLISTEDIPQDNCDGSAEKSNTVERSHTVLRTLELGTDITVDASGRAGIPGFGEVGVGAAVAGHYQVNYGTEDRVSRSVTVAAKEGTNILHTVRQYEIWEIGEVLVSSGGLNQRIPFSFRRDFNMETLPPANLGCPGQAPQPVEPSVESEPSSDSSLATDPETDATELAEVEQPAESVSEVDGNPTGADSYAGWIICWHGRDGYEYLIAYPEDEFREGISLRMNLVNAQGQEVELANDSLKMCLVNGEWYGRPDPNPWFPSVSFAQLMDREILLCSDSPGCSGEQWTMTPQRYFPSVAPALQKPTGSGVHVVTHSATP